MTELERRKAGEREAATDAAEFAEGLAPEEEVVGCECGRFDLECPHTRVAPRGAA